MEQALALGAYFLFVFGVITWSGRTVKSSTDFIIGNRSMNFWLTAMSAHASDMSSWLFMGYPAVILASGLFNVWVSIGLLICMWANWQFLASKLRVQTGIWNCNTFSSYLQKRFSDNSGTLALLSSIFCFGFYVIYLCAGLMGLGLLGEALFGFDYFVNVTFGICLVIGYILIGGYITLAWLDLLQGIFLLAAIWFVPLWITNSLGGWDALMTGLSTHEDALRILPQSGTDVIRLFSLLLGWGLGYFGQPHIITKFMGIRDPKEISKSRNVGMAWMILTLSAATLVGLVGSVFFSHGLADPQMVFVEMVKASFSPFLATLVLCAILAASLNVMSSQLLVMSGLISEDLYHRYAKKSSSKQLLFVSRLAVVLVALAAYGIASFKISSIFSLVQYAWSGLGSAFGPIILTSLYSTRINKYGAIAGMVSGGITAAVWPYLNTWMVIPIDAMIPGFLISLFSIFAVSRLTESSAVVVLNEE